MSRPKMKSMHDVIVDDPEAAMRRAQEVTQQVMNHPNPQSIRPAVPKTKKKRKK